MVSDHHFFCFSQRVLRELSRNPDFLKHDIAFILMVFLSFTSAIPYRQLHLLVAITYGKGVVLKEVYEKMDGQFFAQFIRTHFNITFE